MTDRRTDDVSAFVEQYRRLGDAAGEAALERLRGEDPTLHDLVEEALDASDGPEEFPISPIRLAGDGLFRPGQVLVGKYEIIRSLGEGGQGNVYLARDRQHLASEVGPSERRVAIKAAATPGAMAYLRKEAEMLTRLDHDNLPNVEWVEPQGAFIVMEYVDGTSLKSLAEAEGQEPFAWTDVSKWMDTVLDVLAHLHSPPEAPPSEASGEGFEEGDPNRTRLNRKRMGPRRRGPGKRTTPYVHCDLKPANLIRKENGNLYVVDLGISKSGDAGLTVSAPSDGGGTIGFAAPEVWDVARRAVPQSDLYSLGMTAYELLTGRDAGEFSATEREARAARSVDPFSQELDTVGLPPGVTEWIRKATLLDPLERFASAEDMRRALHRLRYSSPNDEHAGRRPAAVLALAFAGASALGLALWKGPGLFQEGQSDSPQTVVALADSSARAGAEADRLGGAQGEDGSADSTDAGLSADPGRGTAGTTPQETETPPPPTRVAPPAEVRVSPPPVARTEPQPPLGPQSRNVQLAVAPTVQGVPVLVGGQPAGAASSFQVGETHRFDAPQGYDVVYAEVMEGSRLRKVYGRDGAVEIPVTAETRSIEFFFVENLEEVRHEAFQDGFNRR